MRTAAVSLTAAAIVMSGVAPLHAADWPAKPVRIVSPFALGGTSDTLARLIAAELGERLRQSFFVENRGGAGGLIGTAAVAEPDGGTFLISSIGRHVTSPATSANPGYDPLRISPTSPISAGRPMSSSCIPRSG
jgi:tripartite-type tricarboxylate transporter receptor subunit TctC